MGICGCIVLSYSGLKQDRKEKPNHFRSRGRSQRPGRPGNQLTGPGIHPEDLRLLKFANPARNRYNWGRILHHEDQTTENSHLVDRLCPGWIGNPIPVRRHPRAVSNIVLAAGDWVCAAGLGNGHQRTVRKDQLQGWHRCGFSRLF